MKKIPIITLETWDPHDIKGISTDNINGLLDTIQALSKVRSVQLSISLSPVEEDGPALIICASKGQFIVAATLGEDNNFDLIGDPNAKCTTLFNLGGQAIDYPVKYLVSAKQAQEVATKFFQTGTLDIASGTWDKQGPEDSWGKGS